MSEHLKNSHKIDTAENSVHKKSRWANIARDTVTQEKASERTSQQPVFSPEYARAIIIAAGEKLYNQGFLQHKLAGHQIDIALEYFNTHCKQFSAAETIANIALLAVLNVYIIGDKFPPEVTDADSWGSILGVAIHRPHTTSIHALQGRSALENLTAQESEQEKIINMLRERPLRNEFIDKLSANCRSSGLNICQADKSTGSNSAANTAPTSQGGSYAPTLAATKNPYDPFKTSVRQEKENEEEKK